MENFRFPGAKVPRTFVPGNFRSRGTKVPWNCSSWRYNLLSSHMSSDQRPLEMLYVNEQRILIVILFYTRPTQPSTLSRTENNYRPKCGDALWLGSKVRYGSFHLWANVWVAGKTVWSLVNTCHAQRRGSIISPFIYNSMAIPNRVISDVTLPGQLLLIPLRQIFSLPLGK